MAQKVRAVAEKEHRSISNVVASALVVFTSLPKDVRDMLLELQSDPDSGGLKRVTREMMAVAARMRLEAATAQLAAEGIFAADTDAGDDIDLMEEASRLTDEARRTQRSR